MQCFTSFYFSVGLEYNDKHKSSLSRPMRRAAVCSALEQHHGDVATAAKVMGESKRYVIAARDRHKILKTFNDRSRSGRLTVLSKQQKDTAAVLLAEDNNLAKAARILVQQHHLLFSHHPSFLVYQAKGFSVPSKR